MDTAVQVIYPGALDVSTGRGIADETAWFAGGIMLLWSISSEYAAPRFWTGQPPSSGDGARRVLDALCAGDELVRTEGCSPLLLMHWATSRWSRLAVSVSWSAPRSYGGHTPGLVTQ